MKKLLNNIGFWIEFNLGYFMTNGNKFESWKKDIMTRYPEKFKTK